MYFLFVFIDRAENLEDEVLFPASEDVNTVLTNVKKLLQYDTRRRQATAIVLMGVIGAEFQKEVEIYAGRKSNGATVQGAGKYENWPKSGLIQLENRCLYFVSPVSNRAEKQKF